MIPSRTQNNLNSVIYGLNYPLKKISIKPLETVNGSEYDNERKDIVDFTMHMMYKTGIHDFVSQKVTGLHTLISILYVKIFSQDPNSFGPLVGGVDL